MNHWGGGEEFLLKLINNIDSYEFIVVSPSGIVSDRFLQSGIKVFNINSLKKYFRYGNSWSLLAKLKILLNIGVSTVHLIKIILKHRIDFIICNGNYAGLFTLPAALLTFKKIIVVQHLIYSEISIESRILRLLNFFSYKIVCVSEAVSENIKGFLGQNYKNNLVTIYNGILLPDKNNVEKSKKEINIGVIGSIIRIKGIDIIIDSIKDIIHKNPNVHLNIYGLVRKEETDSIQYEKELKDIVANYQLADNIHFRGFIESKKDLYSNQDIIVNYSTITESFSFTVLEAIAYGKIVITTELGGPKEIVSDGYNGFLISQGNKEKLSRVLKYCIDNINSEKFDIIRENGRKTVEEKFSLDKFSFNYKNLFNSI
jgi:glycosyltransferase involved in cell wall biosynthesis